jgi:hypothetical protein
MYKRLTCQTFLMMILALGTIAWGVQMPPWISNDRDLKSALKAAKTPEDHERIAAYYAVKADRQDAAAADYEKAAAACRNGPVVKNLTAPNTAARYEYIAKEFRDAARSNRKLAASHEQIAKNAEQSLR